MQCRSCGVDHPSEMFGHHSRGTLRKDCNPCRNVQEAARRYGATVDEVIGLSEKQDHCCAICGVHKDDICHATFKHNPLVIDHCHTTGKIRGLLCSNCNTLLGHAKDDVRILAQAISYLS